VKYEVPANITLAIAEKEAGKPGQWVRNANGTYDVGPLQFNTSYLRELAQYGITAEDVAKTGCYPYDLAAWRLRGHLRNDNGDLWTRAANYHSRTHKQNAVYRADLMLKAGKWANWLEARFMTHDVTKAGAMLPGYGEVIFLGEPCRAVVTWRPHTNSAILLIRQNPHTTD
jgi:hypothetical protein